MGSKGTTEDPKHEDYEDLKEWMGEFDSEAFSATEVKFANADEILEEIFGDDDEDIDEDMLDLDGIVEMFFQIVDELPLEIRLQGLSLEDRLFGLNKQELWEISKLATKAR